MANIILCTYEKNGKTRTQNIVSHSSIIHDNAFIVSLT